MQIKSLVNDEILIKRLFLKTRKQTKKLSEMETICLLLAGKGLTSAESAKILGIQSSTVETHRKSIKSKLKSSSMAQAVFDGIKLGYLNKITEKKIIGGVYENLNFKN